MTISIGACFLALICLAAATGIVLLIAAYRRRSIGRRQAQAHSYELLTKQRIDSLTRSTIAAMRETARREARQRRGRQL